MHSSNRKRSGRGALALGLSSLLGLAANGCGTKEQNVVAMTPEPQGVLYSVAADQDSPGVEILNYNMTGDLCPSSGATAQVGPTSFMLDVRADPLLAVGSPRVATCNVELELRVTPGYQVDGPQLRYSLDSLNRGVFETSYGFREGGTRPSPARSYNGDPSISIKETPTGLWSPTCDKTSPREIVHFTISMTSTAQATEESDSYLQLLEMSADFSFDAGLNVRPCDGTAPAAPSARANGEACNVNRSLLCQPGLDCEVINLDGSGLCASRADSQGKQPLNHYCGGLYDVECQDHLHCYYRSIEHAQQTNPQPLFGVCAHPIGVEGSPCAGFPETSCGAGLYCQPAVDEPRAGKCKAKAAATECVPNVIACEDPTLQCIEGRCQPRFATAGGLCGKAAQGARCLSGYTCEETSSTCVLVTEPAKEHEACSIAAGCVSPAVCLNSKCVVRPKLKSLNESCSIAEPCEQQLVCAGGLCLEVGDGRFNAVCRDEDDCNETPYCLANRCANFLEVGESDPCDEARDIRCKSPLMCIQQKCTKASFAPF